MGFRNPITSATDVDTRPTATSAGVRMYETPDPDRGLNVGTVEWTDGVPGDAPATAMQTHNPNPRSSLTPYGGLALFGGSYDNPAGGGGKVSSPRLSLEVGTNPATEAVGPQARLSGGPLLLDRPAASSGAGEQWTDFPFIAGAWAAFDTSANMPRYRRDVAGTCHIRGIVKIVVGSGFSIAAGGSGTVGTLPSGFFLPGANHWGHAAILSPASALVSITQALVGPTGVLTVVNNSAAAVGGGYGFALGLTFPTT